MLIFMETCSVSTSQLIKNVQQLEQQCNIIVIDLGVQRTLMHTHVHKHTYKTMTVVQKVIMCVI